MNAISFTIRPAFLVAAAGVLTAALGPSARAQQAPSDPAPSATGPASSAERPDGVGLRLAPPEPVSAADSVRPVAPELELRVASASEFKLNFQPEDPGAAAASSKTEPGLQAAPAEHDSHELAKKLQNPIANLISVPLQFNYDTGFGPNDADRLTLNIEPVIPFSIGEDWNLITRTIVPVIYQESLADGLSSDFGLGDTTQSFFFSPKEPIGGWILGAGPVALWPTGTSPRLRSESLGFGPTLVALKQQHGWTYGALVNHIWSVTDSDDHEQVNNTFLQPFLSYTWPTGTTLAVNTETSYDWSREEWTVPLHGILKQFVKLGGQPMQFEIAGTYYADAPDNGPEWGVRFTITFVFPK